MFDLLIWFDRSSLTIYAEFIMQFVATLWLVLFSPQLWAQGGPPMITDDPDTPGDGHWEINVGTTGQFSAANTAGDLVHVDANYGLGERVQLKFESGETYYDQEGSRAHGLGDSLIGVKVRFFETGSATEGFRVSVYPQVETRGPFGNRDPNLTTPHTLYYLPVEIKEGFGHVAVAADLGREVVAYTHENGWFGGVCLGYTPVKEAELIAEVHNQTSAAFAWQGRLFQIGARLEANEALALMFAMGRLFSDTPRNVYTVGYLGVRITL